MIARRHAEGQDPTWPILRSVPRDLFAEKERFFYEVTFGWPGMPTQTKLVDLGGVVTVGTQIKVDGLWWVVEQLGPAVGGHRGKVRATARRSSRLRSRLDPRTLRPF
jgi:hypothetical protein